MVYCFIHYYNIMKNQGIYIASKRVCDDLWGANISQASIHIFFLDMVSWVADDVPLCAVITGKLGVKYVALNEASDYYGMYSCITHTSSFIFFLLLLFFLKYNLLTRSSLVATEACFSSCLEWGASVCTGALTHRIIYFLVALMEWCGQNYPYSSEADISVWNIKATP